MELDDCITKDCSTIYRFQFASIAFICGIYLPFTFHSNIWLLYTQPFTPVNCTTTTINIKHPFLYGSITNITTRSISSMDNQNRTDCCPCNGNMNDKRLLGLCQEWLAYKNQIQMRKATIIDEWRLACGNENHRNLMLGSISFSIAEIIGLITIGILADQYGRKLMLLMCLYIPVLFGSLAAFTTTYYLFIILRWPVGFLNKSLLILGFIMVIESCEYKHRSQIGCLLLSSIPIFGIIIGVAYFFLLDWRHMQLSGTLIATLTLCYPWLIPESRRWYVNSHRVSRVNKLLQICSTKQSSTLGLNKIGSSAPTSVVYDKAILSKDSKYIQTNSILCLILNKQLRTITFCLFLLWFISSFAYQSTVFPWILPHPTMNYVLMNSLEFFSFIIALIIAYKTGRRPPLVVLFLISGISSISLAIILLGTGHRWLEIIFSLLTRSCLRTCYCLLILFSSELYPTSIRATGLAIGILGEILAKILIEVFLYLLIDRTLLLFLSGGLLCLSCCLIYPLPETLLYDLPDSLNDLQSMKDSSSNENIDNLSPLSQRHHIIDANTVALPPHEVRPNLTMTSDLNDLSIGSPKTLRKAHQSDIHGLSNPCYFTSLDNTHEQYDIERQIDNRVVISIRGTLNNSKPEATRF